jgi:hypothetical protein
MILDRLEEAGARGLLCAADGLPIVGWCRGGYGLPVVCFGGLRHHFTALPAAS